ncbi:hypothetical protein GX563_03175 [Candidatus Bathyarchaeota archaeon]|nr:hypothetical protein [Candidatus Bathyarchaeota archaeon]
MSASTSLKLAMRRLWSDHVVYTRCYIISAIAALQDAQATATRLLKNQEDIGNAIVPFYGQEAGKKLTELLQEHIKIAVELVAAAKTGDQAKFGEADKRWTENANQIAAFLLGANPNWPKKDVTDLLSLHLKITKEEAVARLTGKWEEDIQKFDEIYTEIMVLADALSDGIVKQFPDKFK